MEQEAYRNYWLAEQVTAQRALDFATQQLGKLASENQLRLVPELVDTPFTDVPDNAA